MVFPITTYEVVMVFCKEVGRIVGRPCSVEYAEAVNKTEPISIIKKDVSFFDTSVEQMIQFHAEIVA